MLASPLTGAWLGSLGPVPDPVALSSAGRWRLRGRIFKQVFIAQTRGTMGLGEVLQRRAPSLPTRALG